MNAWIASSSRVKEQKYLTLAKDVAKVFINKKYELVCGGISSSMMKEIADQFQKEKQNVHCITLGIYQEDLSNVSDFLLVDSTFERTKRLYSLADVIVILPGGTGSFLELFASLEEIRTISSNKKIILYNDHGFYDIFIELLKNLIQNDFNDSAIFDQFIVVHTIEELEKKVSEEYV